MKSIEKRNLEIEKLLNEHYHRTNPVSDKNIHMYVCEETADLHFLNIKKDEFFLIVKCGNY